MASKKRKTLQIKRPDPNSLKSKKKPLPKVKMDQKAATSSVDTDELASMGPSTAKVKRPDENNLDHKGQTTRIALPDEDKIRKARRANATQDLAMEEALPSAQQIAHAQKSATMPIMIDTESVEESSSSSLNTTSHSQSMERTMEIDADALSTSNLADDLDKASASSEPKADQTMEIDPSALSTGNITDELADANASQKNKSDQTMQIDPNALATGNITDELADANIDKGNGKKSDQTMQIDSSALATGNLTDELADADKDKGNGKKADQTMQIDPSALATGNLTDELADANLGAGKSDQTMQIDPNALATGNIDKIEDQDLSPASNPQAEALAEADKPEDTADNTMQIDSDALSTGNIEKIEKHESMMAMETMQMEPIPDDEFEQALQGNSDEEEESTLTVAEMKQSFNAQTMEMDAEAIADMQAKKNSAKLGSQALESPEEDRSQTMDLSSSRPKTIMIKRPNKKAPASSSTPTVKAVRPDAVTVRTSRPVTANATQAKAGTSRIDVPDQEGGASKEGKTIKLRRPSGAPSKAPVGRVAGNAGISINDDGSITANPKSQETLGAAWLAVAIITFLLSAGAVWSIYAQDNPDLPMPGRLVDVNNQIIQPL